MTMAKSIPAVTSACSCTRPSVVACLAIAFPPPGRSKVHPLVSIPLESHKHLCPWIGLKHLAISCRHRHRGGKERYMGKVYASLFGVGAPEVLVIGVVALLVFGPKGLAELARNLGKTLRAFQPTIKELQDVSREFKNTLEREIGLDDVPPTSDNSAYRSGSLANESTSTIVNPNGSHSTRSPYYGEDLVRLTKEQNAASAAARQTQEETNLEDQPQGLSDAHSSPEATDTTPASETATSESSTKKVAAGTDLAENSESEGSKS